MRVPLLDLKAQYETIKDEVEAALLEVAREQHFILGPKVSELEEAVAGYADSGWGVGVSSGSDALLVSLMAAGVGRGDYVITTPYTFFATAGAVARTGAVPVFVDIDPETYNIDPAAIGPAAERIPAGSAGAVIPVHLYGQCCDMGPITETAEEHGLTVIEDAAQAIGASDAAGRRAGSAGEMGCFSFFPSKNLGCFGDGGMVVTRDEKTRDTLRLLRAHGSSPKYYHSLIGGNFRLDAIQAAVLLVKLRRLEEWTEKRRKNAARYVKLFTDAGLPVGLPRAAPGCRHVYNQFVIRAPRRDALMEHLAQKGVSTEVYYPLPLHLQECFRYLGYKEGDLPHSEKAARETLALPVYPELTDEMAGYVVDCVEEFYKSAFKETG